MKHNKKIEKFFSSNKKSKNICLWKEIHISGKLANNRQSNIYPEIYNSIGKMGVAEESEKRGLPPPSLYKFTETRVVPGQSMLFRTDGFNSCNCFCRGGARIQPAL